MISLCFLIYRTGVGYFENTVIDVYLCTKAATSWEGGRMGEYPVIDCVS